ncbi:MAG: MFS transporter [Gemmataceae bacterium]|nr:MFS transporter [Gemmataceae bacterium]
MGTLGRFLRRHRTLVVICAGTAGWAFSFGVSAPLAALWLSAAGCADALTGGNTGTYYLGMAVTAAAVPWLMRRWGNVCSVVGMIGAGAATVLFPWGEGVAWWFLVRFGAGAAGALCVIPLETLVNQEAEPEHRSRNFGCYAVAITLGYALGNAVGLELYPTAPRLAFLVGGAVAILSAVPVCCWLPAPMGQHQEAERAPLEVRRNLLSYGSAWNQGFLEGVMITFLPLHLFSLGLSGGEVGGMTSLAVVGVLVVQLPVAWLADRVGRTAVLLGCYGVVILGLGMVPACGPSVWLAVWLFAVGACSGAFYPLGLALLGERLPAHALARANACFLAVECAGCIAGPVVTGHVREWFGEEAMFPLAQAALGVFLLAWVVFGRRGSRSGHPQAEVAETGTARHAA